jgi:hypothetical protein
MTKFHESYVTLMDQSFPFLSNVLLTHPLHAYYSFEIKKSKLYTASCSYCLVLVTCFRKNFQNDNKEPSLFKGFFVLP